MIPVNPRRSTDLPPPRVVHLPAEPISFWLRVAHVYGVMGQRGPDLAPVRILTDYEILLQFDGLSWIWSEEDGGSVDIPAGSVALIPPGFVHAWGWESGRHIAIHFDLHAQPDIQLPDNMRLLERNAARDPLPSPIAPFALTSPGRPPLIIPIVTAVPVPHLWREQLEVLVDLKNRRAAEGVQAEVEIARVLGFALRNLAVSQSPGTGNDDRVLAAIDRLHENIAARTSVGELIGQAGLGETAFREAFVRVVGTTPRRYLEEIRVEHAARALIDTDWGVRDIARTVGYEDPYHFSRVFRRVRGMAPRVYRTRARGGSATG
jgi:AraC-like DNA-binding protein